MGFYDFDNEQIQKALNEKHYEHLECIYGHFFFGIHQYMKKSFTYLTLLRDPIEQIISLYYFIRRSPNHGLYSLAQNLDLKDFITANNAAIQGQMNNPQTRFISGSTSSPDLEIAKYNLQRYFSVVGITERFDESVYLMKKQFGWKDISYKRENVSHKRPLKSQVSSSVLQLIEERTHLDRELYKFGNELFNKSLSELSDERNH